LGELVKVGQAKIADLYGDNGKEWKVTIHHLVCTAFHGRKPPDKDQVAHNNGNPLDCVAS
jgi:hypothetical protein